MGYVGNSPAANFASVTKDTFSGDGSTTAFTLSKAATTNGVAVFVENVRQVPTTAYAVSGTTLTFTAAPSSGTNNIYVLHHNAPASTANHPAGQDLTAVSGTFSAGVSATTGAFTDNVTLQDSDNIIFGTGSDLSISHNGTNSLIANSTGALLISGDDIAMNSSGGESMFSALSNSTVRLYHDNVVKITTAANGMVLGGASADQQIHFDGASDWSVGIDNSDSGFLKISNSDTVGTTDAMVFAASRRIRIGGSTSDAGRLNMNFTHSTGMVGIDMIPDATTATMLQFKNSGGSVAGSITTGGSSTAFNTSSDYRLKENVNYSWDATSRLKQLKPARFNFKADADTTVDGFLAHEVSNIIPEAIFGTKDETRDIGLIKDKDGVILEDNALEVQTKKDEGQTWTKTKTEDVYQGIDQSKLVPLLVKTIQELEARVTALESK